jgi:hypothetical protein
MFMRVVLRPEAKACAVRAIPATRVLLRQFSPSTTGGDLLSYTACPAPRVEGPAVQVKVMSFWRRRPGPEDNYGIAAGQRFFSVGRAKAVWEVVTVAQFPGDFVPHVRLLRVGSQHEAKTVALEVLRDRRFYQPAT